MNLPAGTTIGGYQITAPLGAGGMGEVYRARDTRLNRDVAIKILPEAFAADAERVARFTREAQTLAALNHPHIAHIYGIEEGRPSAAPARGDLRGGSDIVQPVRALVMELVEGETLAERLARGAIPIDEALPMARQIAEALEAAHEQGIIHRDLKPANIKVRPDGTVKVLDFGLAKALDPPAGANARSGSASFSPTITTPAMTAAGMILGTAAYMSPEQARGRAVDQRTDIWAFGCVLFEMLTATRAFPGDDVTDTLAAIVRAEPDWNLLPPGLSPTLHLFLRRALHKDARQRPQAIGDMRLAIEGAFDTPVAVPAIAAATPAVPRWRRSVPPILASVLTAATLAGGAWVLRPEQQRLPVTRFAHDLQQGSVLRGLESTALAVSPDGSRFVFNTGGGLYMREMGGLDARLIPGTERPLTTPFFSPDGQSIGFYQAGRIKRLALSGGASVAIAPAQNPYGATWAADNTILFAQPDGVMRVRADGGTPELIIRANDGERIHGPQLLPGGEWVLFSVTSGGWDDGFIVVESLRTRERRTLLQGGSDARYVSTGHLLYAFEDGLFAVALDLERMALRGGPVSIVDDLQRATGLNASGTAAAHYDVSANGTFVHLRGGGYGSYGLVWVQRNGEKRKITTIPADNYRTLRLSPDGGSVLVWASNDLWLFDIASGRRTRLTTDRLSTPRIAWHPSGSMIAYTSPAYPVVSACHQM